MTRTGTAAQAGRKEVALNTPCTGEHSSQQTVPRHSEHHLRGVDCPSGTPKLDVDSRGPSDKPLWAQLPATSCAESRPKPRPLVETTQGGGMADATASVAYLAGQPVADVGVAAALSRLPPRREVGIDETSIAISRREKADAVGSQKAAPQRCVGTRCSDVVVLYSTLLACCVVVSQTYPLGLCLQRKRA